MAIPLRKMQKDLLHMLTTAFNEMPAHWAVYVELDVSELKHTIVKVEPWTASSVKTSRFPSYNIHRVEATDEMEAYTIMQRTLDRLEP